VSLYLTRIPAALRRVMIALLTGLRRACSGIAELNRQQDRMSIRRLSYDTYMTCPDTPPETFGEFMLRTRGPLRREPSARARLSGRPVR